MMEKQVFKDYRQFFNENGYVLFKNAVDHKTLEIMNSEVSAWIQESRSHNKNFGVTIDGRPRFDLELKTHSKHKPALRRISSPIEISETFLSFTRDNLALDLITQIFSPNIKLLATKINLKLPGSGTAVKYHQDFPFEPHSNDDIMTVLYFLDDVTLKNYKETLNEDSKQVVILNPKKSENGYFLETGWATSENIKVPNHNLSLIHI